MQRATAENRKIYVDLDDVLSETIEPLIELADEMFGRRVTVDEVREFDLARAFSLTEEQVDELMRVAHSPAQLDRFAAKPGASATLGAWADAGYQIAIMTGRPPSTAASSRRWLAQHDMHHHRFACVDKYGRPDFAESSEPWVALDALPGENFALAVEDSAAIAVHLAEVCEVPVALLDRPWNRTLPPTSPAAAERIVRCGDWKQLADRFAAP